jgi:predicted outer membrane protein
MTTKSALLPFTLGLALIFAAAGCAHGPQAEDRDTREAGNPNSVLNKDAPGPKPTTSEKYAVQTQVAQENNPNSVDNKDRETVPPDDKQLAKAQLRAAEQGNPDSVDERLPSPVAALQRLHVLNQDAIDAGRLAKQNGTQATQIYAGHLVRDREQDELSVGDLAVKLHVAMQQPTDPRARKQRAEDMDQFAAMKDVTGPAFDKLFAHQMLVEQRRELETVRGLRARCVEPRICDLLAHMEPELEASVSGAETLTAAVAIDDPRP